MAKRPAFIPRADGPPFYREVDVEFQWFPGFAVTQAQRSIAAMHEALAIRSLAPALEISTKSPDGRGVALSAFNLKVEVDESTVSVESAFQGSKVFATTGPFHDLYWVPSQAAKKDSRLRSAGDVVAFDFFGDIWPNRPTTAFYDWLYLAALTRLPVATQDLGSFRAFTDIAFNPKRSLNCQARSAAIFVGLTQAGQLESALVDRESFLATVYGARSDDGGAQPDLFS